MKKVYLFLGMFGFMALFFGAVYLIAFKKQTNSGSVRQVGSNQSENKTTELALPEDAKVKAISVSGAMAPFLEDNDEKIKYINKKNKTIIESFPDGTGRKEISLALDGELVEARWQKNGERILVEIKNNEQHKFEVFSADGSFVLELEDGTDNAVFDGIGENIFYKQFDQKSKKRSIKAIKIQSGEITVIGEIDQRDIFLTQVNQKPLIAFWSQGKNGEESTLFKMGITSNGKAESYFSGKKAGDFLWSPQGDLILASFVDDSQKLELGIIDENGTFHGLAMPTIVSKCAWAADELVVFCAMPGNIPGDAKMPDDYFEQKFLTQDTIWEISMEDGKKNRVMEPEEIRERYDVSELTVASNRSALFFVNKVDERLYRVSL